MAWLRNHWLKITLGLLGGFLALFVLILYFLYSYTTSFLKSADLSFDEAYGIYQDTLSQRKQIKNQKLTFLILGLDQRADTFENTLLTDTIILASLDLSSNQLTLLPIPRDLWIPELQTKVNALYYYGTLQDNILPAEYVAQELEKVTATPIDYWVVLDYTKLPILIDALGGITVDVQTGFIDEEYPNLGYITGEETEQYTTVVFDEGVQQMDGERALIFVRSRKGNGAEGTDQARSVRQLAVVRSMIHSLQDKSLIWQPETLGNLYKLWDTTLDTNIPDSHAAVIASRVNPALLNVQSHSIPVLWQDTTPPLLINPPNSKYGLSVWEPYTGDFRALQEYIRNVL